MRKRFYIIVLLFLALIRLQSQQTTLYNSAFLNPVIENEAMAGMNKYAQSFLHYRKQWLDIEGAPESALLSVDWPMKNEKSGMVFMLTSDKTNILGHLGVMSGYSHAVKISADQNLRLGLALKLNYNTIYFDKINAEDEFESSLLNYFESATGINANFGASYNFKKLSAGISVKNLLNTKLQYTNETEDKNLYFQYIPQYLVQVKYDYDIRDDISLHPELSLRDIHGMPARIEAGVFGTYQKKYTIGMVFRNKNSLGMLASLLIYDRLTVSYSYQMALGKIKGYHGGTHGITLGYRFYTTHYQEYKPVDTEKIDQLLAMGEKQLNANETLKRDNERLKAEQRKLSDQLKNEKEEISRLKAERESESEEDFDLPDNFVVDPSKPTNIIMGIFPDIYSAKQLQQILRREHQLSTVVFKRKNEQDYMVCVKKKFTSEKSLRRELSKLKRISDLYSNSEFRIYVN